MQIQAEIQCQVCIFPTKTKYEVLFKPKFKYKVKFLVNNDRFKVIMHSVFDKYKIKILPRYEEYGVSFYLCHYFLNTELQASYQKQINDQRTKWDNQLFRKQNPKKAKGQLERWSSEKFIQNYKRFIRGENLVPKNIIKEQQQEIKKEIQFVENDIKDKIIKDLNRYKRGIYNFELNTIRDAINVKKQDIDKMYWIYKKRHDCDLLGYRNKLNFMYTNPILHAAYNNQPEIVYILFKREANVFVVDGEKKDTLYYLMQQCDSTRSFSKKIIIHLIMSGLNYKDEKNQSIYKYFLREINLQPSEYIS